MHQKFLTILFGIIFILSGEISAITIIPIQSLSQGTILYVGGSGPGNYTSIQNAINNATNGDTIFVYQNIYHENIRLNKTLTLIGQHPDTTIIDGDGCHHVITILTDHVTIQGFTIQTGNIIDYPAGINICSSHARIEHNIILHNCFGILNYDFTNITIIHNKFINNICGVCLYTARNTIMYNSFFNDGIFITVGGNVIDANTVNHKPLLYLEDQRNHILSDHYGQIILFNCENITIHNQTIHQTYTGILMHQSYKCHIHNNTISQSQCGMALRESSYNLLKNNDLSQNINYGIGLYSSHNNTIEGNVINEHTQGEFRNDGIHLAGSDYNNISYNLIHKNGVGLAVSGSHYNTIGSNNFVFQRHTALTIYGAAEHNIVTKNIFRQNTRAMWLTNSEYNRVIYNNLFDNAEDMFIEAIQYYRFCFKTLPQIYGNYWDHGRWFPKIIPGTFTFIFNDNPWGGGITINWLYCDWNPARSPNDIG